jgi:hypothetical protein
MVMVAALPLLVSIAWAGCHCTLPYKLFQFNCAFGGYSEVRICGVGRNPRPVAPGMGGG